MRARVGQHPRPPRSDPTTQDAAAPTELSPRIGRTARRELALHGYPRYDQLTEVTAARDLAFA